MSRRKTTAPPPSPGPTIWASFSAPAAGRCSPYRPVTREETAVLLRRYAARLGRDTFLPDGVAACNDYEGISPWADDSLYWAADTGLIDWSSGGRLDPGGTLTPDALENILIRFSGLSCP